MIQRVPHQPRDSRIPEPLLSTPFDPGLAELTAYLVERGYATHTIHLYVRTAAHFGRWVTLRAKPDTIAESTVASFLQHHLPRCRCAAALHTLTDARAALRHLLLVLRQAGRIPSPPVPAQTPIDEAVQRFEAHLRSVGGHADATISYRTRYAREFLTALHPGGPLRLAELTPRDIIAFVRARARDYQPQTTRVLTCSLRSYLRFLCLEGAVTAELAGAVPTVAGWRQASLPRPLSEAQLARLLRACDRTTPTGRRDYAICCCLADLGLRAHEVAGLSLEAIHWRAGTVCVTSTKTHRARLLPLPARLGAALVDYLQHGRPRSTDRHVFLRHVAPRGGAIRRQAVQHAVARACARAGERCCGSHAFRQTFASRLYAHGATFKEIADLLGHQALDTVSLYTKVNLRALATVALPWPEEAA